jgi:hypothetical protein
MRFGTIPLLAAVGGLSIFVAGCGGGSHAPGVAQIGPATTTTGSLSGGSTQSPVSNAASKADFVAFVDCMQKHGIQAQLGAGGRGVSITAGGGPNSPGFQKAQQACQKLLPNGGPQPLSPAQQAQEVKELVALAACMRTHGFPNFPDPSSQGVFTLTPANGVDPNSSQFQSAMTSCRPQGGRGVPLRIGLRVQATSSG